MKSRLLSTVLAIFILIGITACFGGYYMVKDPATDKTYYTDKIKEEKGGAIKLTDANTGSEVTLQNSEITKIKKEEFKRCYYESVEMLGVSVEKYIKFFNEYRPHQRLGYKTPAQVEKEFYDS